MKNARGVFALIFVLPLSTLSAPATEEERTVTSDSAIEFGAPFYDNAILQREMPVPVIT